MQVIGFQEILPIFFCFFDFDHVVYNFFLEFVFFKIQGVFYAFVAMVTLMFEMTSRRSSIQVGNCFFFVEIEKFQLF